LLKRRQLRERRPRTAGLEPARRAG